MRSALSSTAEDDHECRLTILEILEYLGHSIEAASSAEQAIALTKTRRFELLVADIILSGMSGIDLAKRCTWSRVLDGTK